MSKILIPFYAIFRKDYAIHHTKGNTYYFPYSKMRRRLYRNSEGNLGKNHCIYFSKVEGGNFQKKVSHRKCLQTTIYNMPLLSGGECIFNTIIPMKTMFYI